MLLSANVREDIWHFFYGLKLTQKAVRAILQRQTINCKAITKNTLRELISVFPFWPCMTETVQPISGTPTKRKTATIFADSNGLI